MSQFQRGLLALLLALGAVVSMPSYAYLESYPDCHSRPFGARRSAALAPNGDVVVTGCLHRSNSQYDTGLTVRYSGLTGAVVWSARFGDPNAQNSGASAIAIDAAGDIVVTGYSSDAYNEPQWFRTVKYAGATGLEIWRAAYGTTSTARGNSVAFNGTGDVYVTGESTDTIGGRNIRTIKYDGATGAQLWTASLDGSFHGFDIGERIAVDANGDAFVTGESGEIVGGSNFRTVKYDGATGAQLWTSLFGVDGDDSGLDGIIDAGGNFIAAGYGYQTGVGSRYQVIKYDGSTGNVIWATATGGSVSGGDTANSVGLDSAGNVFVTGLADPGGYNMRTIKLDAATGVVLWNVAYNGAFEGSSDIANALVVDSNGDVAVTGTSGDALNSFNNLRTIKYRGSDGGEIWSVPFSGEPGSAIVVDANRNVIVAAAASDPLGHGYGFLVLKYAADTGELVWNNASSVLFVAHDFNADGKGDLLFENTDGRAAIWLMNGIAPIASAGIIGADTGWSVAHVADFDNDGRNDIVWQHTDGRVAIYLMNGTTPSATQQILGAGGGWTVKHTPDLNGDGKADLLFENVDGTVAAWTMFGTTMGSGATLMGPGTGWSVIRTADFDGDGRDDLLWAHTDGRVAIWLMNGTTVTSTAQILNAGSGWSVTHTADLDGDGNSDIVWRNTDGRVAVWLMNGAAMSSGAEILGPGTGWSVTRTGDFDGDGKSDLFFTHTDGRAAIFLMNGVTPTAQAQILNAGSGWSVKRVVDLNGDGKSDIVWENTDGRAAVWLMNGTAMTSGSEIIGAGTGWSVSGVSP